MKLFCLCLLIFLTSCSSHKFAKEGVFVEDVDEYFNPALKINVWTYMDFYPYKVRENIGVKTIDFYGTDKDVLKNIGIKGKGSHVLFSAVPNTSPNYNLLAILHDKKLPQTEGFEKKVVNDGQFYLQKDFTLGRLDIRHVLIPFDNQHKMLSLIYYISTEQHLSCPYCKLDYLAKINTMNLQDPSILYRNSWIIADNVSEKAVDTRLIIPDNILQHKGKVFLKLFAQYESQVGINYFHILDPVKNETSLHVKLLPNRYYLEYADEWANIILRDTIQVKSL